VAAVPNQRPRTQITAIILAKLAAGALPNVWVSKVWAGPGTGTICDCCDEAITASEVQHEIELAGAVVLCLHPRCFLIWQSTLLRLGVTYSPP
jgi:hypothetical protein